MEDSKRRLPLWIVNLFVFAFLFCAVMAYFLWQVQEAKKDFLDHVREHAMLVAEVVRLSARGSVLSKKASEEILEAFLENTARFVDYLDKVEPFRPEELAAFSEEAGLRGIRIQRSENETVEGPPGWLKKRPSGCRPTSGLKHDEAEHLYLFSFSERSDQNCVTVGVTDARIRIMQEQLGLNNIIKTIAGIPQVSYVELKTPSENGKEIPGKPAVTFKDRGKIRVAEARFPLEGKGLVLALNADYLHQAIGRLWRDFFFFSAALASLGVILSLILHRYQASHLMQVRKFERQLASERENASLGRSAAAIAHEIRNPLNALGIGLQRLQLEGEEITDEHKRLIDLMLESVKRANGSVQGLLRYARPQKVSKRAMRLDQLLEDMLNIYLDHARKSGINVSRTITFKETISADPDLLRQVMENLLKNAIEAQPEGGFIELTVERENDSAGFRIMNAGFTLKPEDADQIFNPYFTTKADGTGLGLTISRRIVEAHGGYMKATVPKTGVVQISVCLPAPRSVKRSVLKKYGKEDVVS
jgi:signal transduction histidine kinase